MTNESEQQDPHRDGHNCFACSPTNPIGLQIRFELDGDKCIGWFTPGPLHVGFDNVVHGGLLFTALDDVMANLLYFNGEPAVTAKANIRYRQSARIGETLFLTGEVIERRRRVVKLVSRAVRETDGAIVCEADATFMLDRVPAANSPSS
ncbi:MAG: PaaI family thioesterase [Pseudomonadota bacterium]